MALALHTTTHKDKHMKLDDMLESKFLKQSDFPQDRLLTIVGVKRENMAKEDEAPEYRWTVKFKELDKPMVANSTNLKRIFRICGDDTDDWTGKRIVVYVDPDIEFGGKVVGGLRVRAPKTAPAANTPIAKVEAMKRASQPEPPPLEDDDFNSIPF
jgi:hypothetical protein